MSWQAYVDDQLIGTGMVNKACIIGLNGAVWAQSAGFTITPEECVNLATIANGLPGTVSGEGARPILIAGVKYIFLGTSRERENDVFYIRQGSDGAVIAKTNQCVLVGMYGDGMQPGSCNMTVEKLADYLRDNGY